MQYRNLLVKLAIVAMSLNSISAMAGQGTGNGGDTQYAGEFASLAREVMSKWDVLDDLDLSSITIHSTTAALTQDGFPVDANNYPDRRLIVFNQANWKKMGRREQIRLVTHEYLQVFRVSKDEDYFNSGLTSERLLASDKIGYIRNSPQQFEGKQAIS
jgi:hypothetical protein